MPDNFTYEESLLVDNVINKINIYMKKNNQTLFNLATGFGFSYQPINKLMTSRGVPNISSLSTLASCFGCTVEELVSNKIKTEINVYKNINDLSKNLNNSVAKMFLPADKYLKAINAQFNALVIYENKIHKFNVCKIFVNTQEFDTDGEFIVDYQNKITQIKVIAVSSNFIFIEQNNQESKILIDKITPIYKLFGDSIVYGADTDYINGVEIKNDN